MVSTTIRLRFDGHSIAYQWRRSVVKYGDQGQSGQAIKLFQITPYVNDFQTINDHDSWQTVSASKNYFYLPFLT